MRFEQLQTDLGERPCLAAYETGEAVAVPDLAHDLRFPRFGPCALAAGLTAVFTFPFGMVRTNSEPSTCTGMRPALSMRRRLRRRRLSPTWPRRTSSTRRPAPTYGTPISGPGKPRCTNRSLACPTGCCSRNAWTHAVLRAPRSGTTATILFVDLDRFKSVSDTYGHAIGDELLVSVAQRLTALLRSGDTLGRLGGDEFVILCEELDLAGVQPLAASL